jgi:hypothetical protein
MAPGTSPCGPAPELRLRDDTQRDARLRRMAMPRAGQRPARRRVGRQPTSSGSETSGWPLWPCRTALVQARRGGRGHSLGCCVRRSGCRGGKRDARMTRGVAPAAARQDRRARNRARRIQTGRRVGLVRRPPLLLGADARPHSAGVERAAGCLQRRHVLMAAVGGSRRRSAGHDPDHRQQGRKKDKRVGQPEHPEPFPSSESRFAEES